MYKQAAIIALDKTIDVIDRFGRHTIDRPMTSNLHETLVLGLKERACTGITIAKRLLEEPEPEASNPYFEYHCQECDCQFGVSKLFEGQAIVKCPICFTNEALEPADKTRFIITKDEV